jgi:hypothetical protein
VYNFIFQYWKCSTSIKSGLIHNARIRIHDHCVQWILRPGQLYPDTLSITSYFTNIFFNNDITGTLNMKYRLFGENQMSLWANGSMFYKITALWDRCEYSLIKLKPVSSGTGWKHQFVWYQANITHFRSNENYWRYN